MKGCCLLVVTYQNFVQLLCHCIDDVLLGSFRRLGNSCKLFGDEHGANCLVGLELVIYQVLVVGVD